MPSWQFLMPVQCLVSNPKWQLPDKGVLMMLSTIALLIFYHSSVKSGKICGDCFRFLSQFCHYIHSFNNKATVVECNNSKNKFCANNKATVVECNNSKNKFRATLIIIIDILIHVLSYHSLKIIKPASQECFLQWPRV